VEKDNSRYVKILRIIIPVKVPEQLGRFLSNGKGNYQIGLMWDQSGLFIFSFSSFPVLKKGSFFSLTEISEPVFGFRPV
jgi:hypothetical protein